MASAYEIIQELVSNYPRAKMLLQSPETSQEPFWFYRRSSVDNRLPTQTAKRRPQLMTSSLLSAPVLNSEPIIRIEV